MSIFNPKMHITLDLFFLLTLHWPLYPKTPQEHLGSNWLRGALCRLQVSSSRLLALKLKNFESLN